jgi:uncharacterized BrkB/YihY/UPF0761 family membrane protein
VTEDEAPTEVSPKGRLSRLRYEADRLKVKSRAFIEIQKERRPTAKVVFDFYERDRAFAGSLLAGGLSVKLFLWFLPFSLAFVVVVGTLSSQIDRTPQELAESAGLAAVVASIVSDAVSGSSQARLYLGLLGGILMLWSALAVVRALRLVSRLAWSMPRTPPFNAFLAALGFSGLLLAIILVNAGASSLFRGSTRADVLVLAAATTVSAALLTLGLNWLPRPEGVPWTAVLPGAIFTAGGFLVVRLATIVYLAPRLTSASELYGGLGMASVFLLWLYVLSRTLVAAISLDATLWQRGSRAQTLSREEALADPRIRE